jgi:hypothetical protein
MAQSVGSLNVRLGADTQGLTAGLTKAESKIGGFAQKAKASLGGLASAAGRGIGLLTSAFAGIADDKDFARIDRISKLADRLNLSTEALAALEHGADLSGVSVSELTGGLETLYKNLGKAQLAGEESAANLERFGISAAKLKGLGTEDVLGEIADVYASLTDSVEKAALLTAAFGKSGQRLAPLFAEGSEGLKEFRAEADKLGITFDRLKGKQVEGALDAITRSNKAWSQFKQNLVISVSPLVEGLASLSTAAAGLWKELEKIQHAGEGWEKIQWFVLGGQEAFLQKGKAFESAMGPAMRNRMFRALGFEREWWKKIPQGPGFFGGMMAQTTEGRFGGLLEAGQKAALAETDKAVESVTEGLLKQAQATRMGAEAFQLYELSLKGASIWQWGFAAALQRSVTLAEQAKAQTTTWKGAAALEVGSAEAISALNALARGGPVGIEGGKLSAEAKKQTETQKRMEALLRRILGVLGMDPGPFL